MAADIVTVLLHKGPLSVSETANRVGIARSTLSWRRLERVGLVESRPDRGRTLAVGVGAGAYRPPRRPRRPVALSGRLVDRFSRLVDTLIEE